MAALSCCGAGAKHLLLVTNEPLIPPPSLCNKYSYLYLIQGLQYAKYKCQTEMIKVLKLDFLPPEDQIVKQGSLKVLVMSVDIVGFFTVWVETVSLELLGTLVL